MEPKDDDTFTGMPGAILSGAQVLTNFAQSGTLWVAGGQSQQQQMNGLCDTQHPQCAHPEDLYFDNRPLLHVGDIGSVVPGTWYFDYDNQLIYFADDPTGHTVEASVARSAFFGAANHVTIQGLTVEKYAVPAQFGAIGDQYPGPNWVISNNEVRWNHGVGINLADGSQALNNYVHDNGEKGIGGGGQNILVQGNEISFNNWAGFLQDWEAGGAKFAQTNFLTVRGNNIHDNNGPGLWNDEDSVNTTYDGNTITNNAASGIQYEISYMATISNNVLRNNSSGTSNWLWGSQILIQNSSFVAVYGNTVEINGTGNGIGIIQQNRGSGLFGPRMATNNFVYGNTIIQRQSSNGLNGQVADFDPQQMVGIQNNQFDYNSYHLIDPTVPAWLWGAQQNWDGLHAAGQELHGTLDSNIPPPQ